MTKTILLVALTVAVGTALSVGLGLRNQEASGAGCCGDRSAPKSAPEATAAPAPAEKAAGGCGGCGGQAQAAPVPTAAPAEGGHHAPVAELPVADVVKALEAKLASALKAAEAGDAKEAAAEIAKAQDVLARLKHRVPALSAASSGAVSNTVCPIMGNKINPNHVKAELTREFNGQKIGFCCAGCPEKWDKLTDDEKTAKLAALHHTPQN